MKKILFYVIPALTVLACGKSQASGAKDYLAPDSLQMTDISAEIDFGYQTERTIDIIVIHSNYNLGRDSFSTKGCIRQFRDNNVAPHYMIERNGNILRLVDERHIAWHAGKSALPGTDRTSLNQNSIGIEVINSKTQGPTPQQYESLVRLVTDIRSRHDIKYLMRHSDIAPDRKTDPWKFDWVGFCEKVRATSGDIIYVEDIED